MKHVAMLLYKDVLYDARVQREALALAQSGIFVHIICVKEYELELEKLHQNIEVIRVNISVKQAKSNLTGKNKKVSSKFTIKKLIFKVIRLPMVKLLKDILSYQEFYRKAFNYMKVSGDKWQVIHSHDLNTLWQGARLARDFNTKLIYDSHELFNEMAGRNKLDKKVGYFFEGKLLKQVDHLILVNPFVQIEFEKRYSKKPVTIIQNTPINTLAEEQDAEERYFHQKYHLHQKARILIYQGGINPHRGLYNVVDTVKLLPDNFYLVMMGDGRLKGSLQDKVNSLQLSHRVFFHDQVPSKDVLWYTKQADIGLVMYENTSQNNYFSTPNKIFEYMIAGIPTVASNHPGKSYVVEKEQTGICTEEDPESISRAILTISERYAFYQKQCMEKRKKYNWDVEKEKLQALYKSIVVH
ncbi:glycosyltransferase [Bacillus weihaiensis]|uniref:glycosyltransferase n=1 Tax=Bacillus weihaiensis TaxID=1547283 RepID=UPI0023541457|nr:glycosyltransferase [Bacillus weihaiensis]